MKTINQKMNLSARGRRTLLWAAVVFAIVMVLPVSRYLTGDLKVAPAKSKPKVLTQREFGDQTVEWVPVFDIQSGTGASQAAFRKDLESGVPSRVEVITRAMGGGTWVVDRPQSKTRVRMFYGNTVSHEFFISAPATLFTSGRGRDLWYNEVEPKKDREALVRVDERGRVLGRYRLPDRLFPRAIVVSPAGDVYMFTEEWTVDMRAGKARYSGQLWLIVRADGTPIAESDMKPIKGNLVGRDGLVYGMESTTPAYKASTSRTFTVVVRDANQKVRRTIKLPVNEVLLGVTDGGLVATRQLNWDELNTPGTSSFGDPIQDFSVRLWDERGLRATTRLSRTLFISNWVSALNSGADGGTYSISVNDGKYTLWRMKLHSAVKSKKQALMRTKPSLRLIVAKEPLDADPYGARDVTEREIFSLIYSGLVSHDASLAAVPDLAKQVPTKGNGGVSADGRVITFHLKLDRKWHDGVQMTPKDVVATWTYLRTRKPYSFSEPFPGFRYITGVRGKGSDVVVTLSKPFGVGPESFFPFVLPSHRMPQTASGAVVMPLDGSVGCGPYRLAQWDSDGWLLKSTRGPGGIGTIRVAFAVGDTAKALFDDKSIPTIWTWVEQQSEAALLRSGATKLRIETGRWWGVLVDTHRTGFTDPQVRRSLNAAIPLNTLRRDFIPNSNESGIVDSFPIESGAHDASASARIGASSAHVRASRKRPLQVMTTNRSGKDETPVETVDVVANSWTKAGVYSQTSLDAPRMYSSWWDGGAIAYSPYDAVYALLPAFIDPGWGGVFDPADTPGPTNSMGLGITRTDDPVLASLYRQARESYSPAVRNRLGRKITRRVQQLGLGSPINYEVRMVAISAPVSGVAPAAFPAGLFWNVRDWSIAGYK